MSSHTSSDEVLASLRICRHEFLAFLASHLGAGAAEDILKNCLQQPQRCTRTPRRHGHAIPALYRAVQDALAEHDRSNLSAPVEARAQSIQPGRPERDVAASQACDDAVRKLLDAVLSTLNPRDAQLLTRIDLRGEPKVVVRHDLLLSAAAFDVALHRARTALNRRLETLRGG